MAHVLAPAVSGRARCRGCARLIERGELRFGERLPNLFGEGETTLWFHPACAAYKRPQSFLEVLGPEADLPDRSALERAANQGVTHRRLPRLDGAERSPSGRASCRLPYFGIDDILEQLLYFSRELSLDEREELRRACQCPARPLASAQEE